MGVIEFFSFFIRFQPNKNGSKSNIELHKYESYKTRHLQEDVTFWRCYINKFNKKHLLVFKIQFTMMSAEAKINYKSDKKPTTKINPIPNA